MAFRSALATREPSPPQPADGIATGARGCPSEIAAYRGVPPVSHGSGGGAGDREKPMSRVRPPSANAAPSTETRCLDAESQSWIVRLGSDSPERDAAIEALHALLLKATRFEVKRRCAAFPHIRGDDYDDLAVQSANDALVAILGKLGDFRGDSRFTTWVYKFGLFEAAVKVRRRAWQGREVPAEPETWPLIADGDPTPEQDVESRELSSALREAIGSLTPHQRQVLVALVLNGVPIDVLAERRQTTRGALYKTLHDARRKIRIALAESGLDVAKHAETTRHD
jgi:RNA polymerase sigma-70 factor (ECF subfamily)